MKHLSISRILQVALPAFVVLLGSAGCKSMTGDKTDTSRPTFDVVAFGANGNDATLDTAAFKSAITACQQAGGGTVRVPRGTYIVQPLDFVSGMTLHLDSGAIMLFTTDESDFPLVETRWEGIMRQGRRPCLWANGCRDVAITGSGIIDGQGAHWWAPIQEARREREKLLKQYPTTAPASRPWDQDPSLRRPPLVQFRDCVNVNIEGVTFQNSPFWTTHLLFSDNITVRNAQFLAPQDGPNTDAMDIDSCRKVLVEGCHASVGDDAFTLKSGKDEDGRRVARPTEDVTVRDCTVAHAHGGVVIGSETSGSVRRVRFSNCTFDGTDAGVRIKSARGRGAFVEDVQASDIRMTNVKTALVISMRYAQRPGALPEPVSERTPRFHDILLSNIVAHDSNRAATIEGLEEMPIINVTVSNFDVTAKEGIVVTDADSIDFRNVKIVVETTPTLKADRFRNIRIKDWTESQRPPSTTAPSTSPIAAAADQSR